MEPALSLLKQHFDDGSGEGNPFEPKSKNHVCLRTLFHFLPPGINFLSRYAMYLVKNQVCIFGWSVGGPDWLSFLVARMQQLAESICTLLISTRIRLMPKSTNRARSPTKFSNINTSQY
jgi:hypothetical protein